MTCKLSAVCCLKGELGQRVRKGCTVFWGRVHTVLYDCLYGIDCDRLNGAPLLEKQQSHDQVSCGTQLYCIIKCNNRIL